MDEEQGTSDELDALIEEQRWDSAFVRLLANPDEAKKIANPSLGWTKLHWLCSIGATPFELLDLVASLYPDAITMPDRRCNDTPLHLVCRQSQTSSKRVKALLAHLKDPDGVLIRNRFGGTSLHSAANHNATIETFRELVRTNSRIVRVATREGVYAVATLWHAYVQTIQGHMCIAHALKGDNISSEHFARFWEKAKFLASEYFRRTTACPEEIDNRTRFVLHGLIQCNVDISFFKIALKIEPGLAITPNAQGSLPLHILVKDRPYRLKERQAIVAALQAYPRAALIANKAGYTPLLIAIGSKLPWENGLDCIANAALSMIQRRDPLTGLFPFLLAASNGGPMSVSTTYHLLSARPDLLRPRDTAETNFHVQSSSLYG